MRGNRSGIINYHTMLWLIDNFMLIKLQEVIDQVCGKAQGEDKD